MLKFEKMGIQYVLIKPKKPVRRYRTGFSNIFGLQPNLFVDKDHFFGCLQTVTFQFVE